MASILRINVLTDARQSGDTFDKLGKKIAGFGKVAAAGLAVAGAAVVAFGVQAIKSASAVEQAVGATESIYGKYADSVIKKSKQAAVAVGLSQSAYLDLANVLGAQLKNAGTPMDKLSGKTDKLIGLGADLAATFGGSTADAVAAVSSLLKGERDPIEKYGVSIKQADVNARLAAKGLTGLTGAAQKQAEAAATLEILMGQTKDATGAFGRESDTAAHKAQVLGAKFENMKATVGAGLLPILVQMGTYIEKNIAPAVQLAAEKLGKNLGPALLATGKFISEKVIPAAKSLIVWFQEKLAPGIARTVTPIVEGLRKAFKSVGDTIERNGPAIEKIQRFLKGLVEFMVTKVEPIVGGVIGKAFEAMGKALSLVGEAIFAVTELIAGAVEWIQRLVDRIQNSKVAQVISDVAGGVKKVVGLIPGLSAVSDPDQVSAAHSGSIDSTRRDLISNLTVQPTVNVFIGEREITDLIRTEVLANSKRVGARVSAGVL